MDDSDELLELSDEELDRLDELDDPTVPNISILAKYLSMQLGSSPNSMGLFSLIIQPALVRILVQLKVTAPTFVLFSKSSRRTLSAAEM